MMSFIRTVYFSVFFVKKYLIFIYSKVEVTVNLLKYKTKTYLVEEAFKRFCRIRWDLKEDEINYQTEGECGGLNGDDAARDDVEAEDQLLVDRVAEL
jgi:hypothetical protein